MPHDNSTAEGHQSPDSPPLTYWSDQ